MTNGIGNIMYKGITLPSGLPFPAGSAMNGLSVDPVTGAIVLGQDAAAAIGPAQLLSGRVIPVDAFTVSYIDPALNVLFHDAKLLEIQHSAGTEFHINGQGFMTIVGNDSLFPKTPFISLQDDSLLASTVWFMRNLAGVYSIEENNTANRMLALDFANLQATIGDVDNMAGGTKLFLDNNNLFANIETAAGSMMQLSQLSGVYTMGDVADITNGTKLLIQDVAEVTTIRDILGRMLELDRAAGLYEFGDIDAAGNGANITINDAIPMITAGDVGGNVLQMVPSVFNVVMGDVGGIINGTTLNVDDAVMQIQANATAGFYVNGSGQLIGSLQTLTDNAAAQAATLTNAPLAGNPTKWIPIDDNGTIRNIPVW